MVPGVEQRHLVARDGTRIGYQVRGQGPAVVLANGLGGTYLAFRHIYDALDGYRVLCWDYRGLYTSDPPKDVHANTMAHHVDDLEDVLAAEGVERAVHVGWSMGVQANFEYLKRAPARVAGLAIINGTYGRPFRTVLSSRFVERVIPVLLRLVKAQASLVGRATKALAGSAALITAMKRFGMVSETIDLEVFREVAAGFKGIDWIVYSDLLHQLGEHDAEDALALVTVPTTIISGDRDILTPPFTAERIHRAIPGSRLTVIRGGTHYTPVEYPAILQDELRRLLARVPGWDVASAA
jgi:pimeloyl-ACP methyl ester carboxylesterase